MDHSNWLNWHNLDIETPGLADLISNAGWRIPRFNTISGQTYGNL